MENGTDEKKEVLADYKLPRLRTFPGAGHFPGKRLCTQSIALDGPNRVHGVVMRKHGFLVAFTDGETVVA